MHKLFKFNVNFAARSLLRILVPINFPKGHENAKRPIEILIFACK